MANSPSLTADGPAARIERDVALATQCRFEVGGPADYFAAVRDSDELRAALRFAREHDLRHFVYSGGSNLFFDDTGFRGLVIRVQGGDWRVSERELPPSAYVNRERSSPRATVGSPPLTAKLVAGPCPIVTVGSGYDLPTLVRELAQRDLGGIEFLGNIPGSVGGAVVGNAGCYGRAVAEVFVEAEVFDVVEDRGFSADAEFCQFAYRHSRLKDDARWVVMGCTLRLTPRAAAEILGEVEGELDDRLRKHPHFSPCAGSFFKNPPGYPAWRVITDAGLADTAVGGARLHEKHANFLVNAGGATSADIRALVRRVQDGVREKLGLELEPEVRYVGPEGISAL